VKNSFADSGGGTSDIVAKLRGATNPTTRITDNNAFASVEQGFIESFADFDLLLVCVVPLSMPQVSRLRTGNTHQSPSHTSREYSN